MQQELKSEQTKQIIIDQAFKLFYEQGFKTTSIDKIMKATTFTKGAFYHHYKNKRELGLEVIGLRVRKRVYDSMIVPLYETGAALMILETTFIRRLKLFPFYEMQHGCPMNNLINEIGDYESVYGEALRGIVDEWKSALVLLLERGKRENQLSCPCGRRALSDSGRTRLQ